MKRIEAIVAVAMAMSLSSCVLRGKPTVAAAAIPVTPAPAPAPPPEPKLPANLSETQTKAELPQAQPLSQEAIASAEPPEEVPVAPPPRRPPGGRRPGSSATSASNRPEPVGPAAAPAAVTAAPPTPAEPERPLIQEILPPAELSRLQNDATKKRQETAYRLQQLKKHRLGKQEQDQVEQIQSFLRLSDDAQKKGDMRKASELAEKALVLAKAMSESR